MMNQPKSENFCSDLKAQLNLLQDLGVEEAYVTGSGGAEKGHGEPEGRGHLPSDEGGSPRFARDDTLQSIRDNIGDCQRCKLCKGRTNIVFGVGNPKARLMFVGEGPGRDEDLQGEPFVGRAGQLLTKMIEAMGYKRSDIYIGNIVKCRPPDNRYPEPDEVETCLPFLIRQIEAIHPEVIITLGNLATQTLLNTTRGITSLRGNFQDWNGFRVMPTYHPAFLLRNPNMKKPCWEDLQKVMSLLKANP